MKKMISVILCLAIVLTLIIGTDTQVFASTKTLTSSKGSISMTTTKELKNWQQTDSPWGSYVVSNPKAPGPNNNIWCTGCGIVSLCNAVHYALGYFMDPSNVAEWANKAGGYHGDYSDGDVLYTNFYNAFHDQLGFTCTTGSGSFMVVQYLGDNSKQVMINRITNEGVTFVAHVYNHFISIVDYDPQTDKFLVWDNAAGNRDDGTDGYTTNRVGITHFGGDWMTYEQFRGTLANRNGDKSKFKVDYVVPIVPVEGKQYEYVARDDLMFGQTKLQVSGKCCNFTVVDFTKNGGNTLDFKGSYTGKNQITSFGYSIDGGSTVWVDSAALSATSSAQTAGQKMVGTGSYTKNFNVQVPVTNGTTRVNIYVKCGSETRMIWTAQRAVTGTTAVYAPKQKVFTAKTFVARDEILCGSEYAVDQHGNYPETYTDGFDDFIGRELTFCGWFATNEGQIQSFGYKLDYGTITYNNSYKSAVSQGAQSHADSQVGTPNYTAYYTIPVKLSDNKAHTVKLYAKVGGNDVLLWTIKKTATTPKQTAAPTQTPYGDRDKPTPQVTFGPTSEPTSTTAPENETTAPTNTQTQTEETQAPTSEQSETQKPNNNQNAGCNGAFAGGMSAAMLLGLASVLILKKEQSI